MNPMTSLSMSSSTYDDEKECKLNRNYSNASIEILSNDNQISSAFPATQRASKYFSDLSLTMTNHNDNIHSTISDLENETLSIKGYKYHQFISRTLQGHVFIAKRLNGINNNNDEVVIKTANIKWHQQQITITNDGKVIKIKENMFKEAHFLKIFNHKSCIKYYDFFWDKEQFYLVMEKGKQSLFEFVVDSHKLIDNNKISMNLWINNMVKPIFKQMVDFIHYMHINQSCCNLDISLENIIFSSSASMTESDSNLNIKFIDFGLTQQFKQQDGNNNDKFVCFDFVGKTQYKSPQIYEKKKFLANKADIWSLGVCLFLLIFGAPPYIEPNKFDAGFLLIYNVKLDEMLKSWGKFKYISSSLYDLLSQMLRYDEDKRIDIVGIKDHEWLKEEEEEEVAINDNGNDNNNINNNNISISNEAKTVFIESSNTSNEDSNINAWIATIE